MAIYYFDTSIWLDYYEKRGKNGEHAFNLILKIIEEDSIIIYSDLHIRELKGLSYNAEQINDILRIVKSNNLRRVHIDREQDKEAAQLCHQKQVPKGDVLHAILARDNNAIMVSRDQHFERLKHIIEIKKPEELL